MRPMGKQAILTKVWKHLRKQGAKCVAGPDESCAYRGTNGMQCAIGALIPDELYDQYLEGMGAECFIDPSCLDKTSSTNQRRFPVIEKIRPLFAKNIPEGFLSGLQQIHDYHDVARWERSLTEFADKHGLKVLPLEKEHE